MPGGWSEEGGVLAALRPLFKPEHVAVIGASATPGKQGNTAIRYIRAAGFAGTLSPVNPSGGEIEGLACYTSIADVPGPVDCALFVIPAGATVEAVKQCAAAGVRTAVIGSSGFAELGSEDGRQRQAAMVEAARAGGMRLLGPNTNGLYNATDHVSLGYSSAYGEPLQPGVISIAGHSGALFPALLPRLQALGRGLSKYVPVGNEADLDILDILEYFVADDATRVIGLIIEAVQDGARLRELASHAREAGKPIVALKLGRSVAGAGAALAHSSRLAGSARAYDALFRECGIARVPAIESLVGACALLSDGRLAEAHGDQSLICISSSGGGGSMLADHAALRGITLAGKDGAWTGATAELVAGYTGSGLLRNPLDSGNLGGWQRLGEILESLETDGHFGPLLSFSHRLPNIQTDQHLSSQLIARAGRVAAPVVLVAPGGLRPEVEAEYVAAGIPLFHDVGTCFDSLAAYYELLGFRGEDLAAPGEAPGDNEALVRTVAAKADGARVLSELDSAEILKEAGLTVVESRVVASAAEAASAADAYETPLVLKALAPEVAHKSKLGLVITGIAGSAVVEVAYRTLEQRIEAHGFRRADVSIVLQPMLPARAELIAGLSREAGLGHFLVAGLGGIHTELFDEVVLMPVPVARARIRANLDASRVGRLLAALDETGGLAARLVEALQALQRLALACGGQIDSVDVNPLLVGEDALTAVDALVVLGEKGA